VTALNVEHWHSLDNLGFLGIGTGDFYSVNSAAPKVPDMLGYVHYGEADVGKDMPPILGQAPGSQGFTIPLGPCAYSFWVRQGGGDPANWDLNFVVEGSTVVPVPQPSGWGSSCWWHPASAGRCADDPEVDEGLGPPGNRRGTELLFSQHR